METFINVYIRIMYGKSTKKYSIFVLMDELDYIIDLYDDADAAVTAAVDRFFVEKGSAAVSALNARWRNELDPVRKEQLSGILSRQTGQFVLRRLSEIRTQSEQGQECSLLEAGYLLSALFNPAVSREEYNAAVMPAVIAVMAETSDDKTAVENLGILNHIFYKRYGFTATDPFGMTEDNTLIMNVLSGRKGNPIALSMVYFIIAQGAGLPIYPLCFKGGFVPVYEENGRILFNINVFHQGEAFFENKISGMVKTQAAAMGLDIDIGEPEVKKDHSIIVMYLEYVQMLYANGGGRTVQLLIDDAIAALGSERFLTLEQDEDEW